MATTTTPGSSQKRNPKFVKAVTDAQVFVNFNDDAERVSQDGIFPEGWETLGILDEGSSLGLNKTVERTKKNGWGLANVNISGKPGEVTGEVTVLEKNPTVKRLMFAKTQLIDGVTVEFHDGELSEAYVAYVAKQSDGTTVIRTSRYKAYLSIEDLSETEEINGKTVSIDFISGGDKDIFESIEIEDVATVGDIEVLRFVTDPDAPEEEPSEESEEPSEDPEEPAA